MVDWRVLLFPIPFSKHELNILKRRHSSSLTLRNAKTKIRSWKETIIINIIFWRSSHLSLSYIDRALVDYVAFFIPRFSYEIFSISSKFLCSSRSTESPSSLSQRTLLVWAHIWVELLLKHINPTWFCVSPPSVLLGEPDLSLYYSALLRILRPPYRKYGNSVPVFHLRQPRKFVCSPRQPTLETFERAMPAAGTGAANLAEPLHTFVLTSCGKKVIPKPISIYFYRLCSQERQPVFDHQNKSRSAVVFDEPLRKGTRFDPTADR